MHFVAKEALPSWPPASGLRGREGPAPLTPAALRLVRQKLQNVMITTFKRVFFVCFGFVKKKRDEKNSENVDRLHAIFDRYYVNLEFLTSLPEGKSDGKHVDARKNFSKSGFSDSIPDLR